MDSESEDESIIFRLDREDYNYRGILFAEVDNDYIDRYSGNTMRTPKSYIAGIMAIIWTDEKGGWHAKMRIKFPSGNKQVTTFDYTTPECKSKNINETFVLHELYRFPMVNKIYTSNPSGTPKGIVDIIESLDMIESQRIEPIK